MSESAGRNDSLGFWLKLSKKALWYGALPSVVAYIFSWLFIVKPPTELLIVPLVLSMPYLIVMAEKMGGESESNLREQLASMSDKELHELFAKKTQMIGRTGSVVRSLINDEVAKRQRFRSRK